MWMNFLLVAYGVALRIMNICRNTLQVIAYMVLAILIAINAGIGR